LSFTLRPRQQTDLNDVRHELRTHRSCLLVAPCGYGKGVVTTKIIEGSKLKGKHVLFIVYGRDRVNDMDERVTKLGIEHGVIMGDRQRARQYSVQVASVSTLHRMEHLPSADLIIVDECHLGLSPTFRAVLDLYPAAKIIGLTATPVLGNGKPLGKASGGIFESMVKGPTVKQLIGEGFLCRSRVIAPPPPAGIAGIRKKKTGEFDENQGAAVCDNPTVIGDIVAHWKQHSSDRKTVAFGFHQAHAFHIAESFRAAGVNFAYIDADTPDGDSIHEPGTRKFIMHQYDHGDLVGIASVGVISIGWDHSICKSLIFASKTASFPRYHQRLGRGSRPHKGFTDFLVLDHTGNLYEHEEKGPFFESDIDWQLDGDPVCAKDGDSAERVRKCDTPVIVPDTGVPAGFTGEMSKNGEYMLCCFGSFPPGPKSCPYCGIPLPTRTQEIEVEEGQLQELTLEDRERMELKIRQESERKAYYLDLVKLQMEKGYRPGYAIVVFKSRFGYFPPRGWKAEVERIVA